jgi:hypothetical protein
MIEKAASTIVSAISLGVFWRIAEARAWLGGDLHDDPVGQDAGAAGDARVVAARLADDRRALAGDRALVDRGDPLDNLAVGGDHLTGLDDHEVARPEPGGRDDFPFVGPEPVEAEGRGVGAGGAQAISLGPAAGLRQRLGEVGEQDGDQQQERQRPLVDDQAGGGTVDDRLHGDDRRQERADLHQEHDRVLHHVARVEHDERLPGRVLDQRRLEQLEVPRLSALELIGLGVGGGPLGEPDFGIEGHGVHSRENDHSEVSPRGRAAVGPPGGFDHRRATSPVDRRTPLRSRGPRREPRMAVSHQLSWLQG